MARVITAALNPVRADTGCFVNREELLSELVELLEVYARSDSPSLRVVLVGEKGIGKTIASRRAMDLLRQRLEDDLIAIEVEGRGVGFRGSLKTIARGLAEQGSAYARAFPKRAEENPGGAPPLRRLIEEIGLLAMSDSILDTDTQSIARNYGIDTGVEGGLFGLLQGKALFRWNETRTTGSNITRMQTVTDELLYTAIQEVMAACALRKIPVLLFFNDLDQTLPRESSDALREMLGRLVALEPCLQIVNVRPEVLYDDLRRESQTLEVGPMSTADLLKVYERRAALEMRPRELEQLTDPRVRELATALAEINGNPLSFLTWLEQGLRLSWPPPKLDAAFAAQIAGRVCSIPDKELLRKAAQVVDRCSSSPRDWCGRDDLLMGQPRLGAGNGVTGLTAREIDQLVQYGVLVPRDVFLPERGLRLDPNLDLLRPSLWLSR